ncbi:hypothetical protein SDC9_211082 [bioreactor metagenome]|uniref:Uncharacterized protein n=1 Tax=bioreactor metagenome TaxID=1076179 RepID=A0A645JTP5_9ZZZZ
MTNSDTFDCSKTSAPADVLGVMLSGVDSSDAGDIASETID